MSYFFEVSGMKNLWLILYLLIGFPLEIRIHTILVYGLAPQDGRRIGFLSDGTDAADSRVGMEEAHAVVNCLVNVVVVLRHELYGVLGEAEGLVLIFEESSVAHPPRTAKH